MNLLFVFLQAGGGDKYLSCIGVGQPFPLVLEKESDRFDKVKGLSQLKFLH